MSMTMRDGKSRDRQRMAQNTPHTEEKPYTRFPVDGVPTKRVHCLSILFQLGDDDSLLSPAQREAFYRLYRLRDDRRVDELVRSGEIRP